MKTVISALAFSALLATSAGAGALNDPIIENDVVAMDTAANSSSNGVPLVLFLFAAMLYVAAD